MEDTTQQGFIYVQSVKARKFSEQTDISSDYEEYSETVKPDQKVTPKMIVTEFYQGGMVSHSSAKYCPSFTERCRNEPRGREIRMEDIFDECGDALSPNHVTIVGPAGSGKTTLLKTYVRRNMKTIFGDGRTIVVIDGKNYVEPAIAVSRPGVPSTCEKAESSDSNINSEGRATGSMSSPSITKGAEAPTETKSTMSLSQFLFGRMQTKYLPHVHYDLGYAGLRWMRRNPEKVLFVVDSLDTLPFVLNDEHQTIKGDDTARPATILYNILTGKLFPGSKILSSSREYAISGFRDELRADRVIALVGLSDDSIRKHMKYVLGPEDGEVFIAELQKKYPGLWALCATPVYLNFTLIGHFKQSFMPTTMTGVLVNLLQDLLRSKHAASVLDITPIEVVDRLKKLSYKGIQDRKVTFEVGDLKEVRLTTEMVTALSISVPGKFYKIMKGNNLMFFTHQSIEELLCGLYVIQMEKGDYEEYVNTELHRPENSVVRRFVSGLLLHNEVHQHAFESGLIRNTEPGIDFDDKRKKFLASLSGELKKKQEDKYVRMELYITAHEAGEGAADILNDSFKSISLVGHSMRPSDMHAVGSVVKHCGILPQLDLSNCRLSPANIEALAQCISSASVQVKKFILKNNLKLKTEGFKKLGMITKKCAIEAVAFDDCGITSEEIEAFAEGVGDHKMEKLSLGDFEGSVTVTEEMAKTLCLLLPKITRQLKLHGWIFKDEGVENILQDLLQNMKDKDKDSRLTVRFGENCELELEGERYEDACDRAIDRITDFPKFARSRHGLRLKETVVRQIYEDNRIGPREKKVNLLAEWAAIKGRAATATSLNRTVDLYHQKEYEDTVS